MTPEPDRGAWLESLAVGDEVIDHDVYAPPTRCRVVHIDGTRIFYGPPNAPDWVWRETGDANPNTSRHRWIEPPP